MAKELKNQYGVKVGDVFYLDIRHVIHYFQVVALRGKSQVTIREIEFEKVEENEYKEDMVIPYLNHFKNESTYIEDNNIGMSKTIQKHVNSNEEYLYISFNYFLNRSSFKKPYQKMAYYEMANLWDGKPKVHYIDYIH